MMNRRRARAETLIRIEKQKGPRIFVSGLTSESNSSTTTPIGNPEDGSEIGRCPISDAHDVERATAAARTAFARSWSSTTSSERANVLRTVAELVEREIDDLAILESLETGRTHRETLEREVKPCVDVLRHAAGLAGRIGGEVHDLSPNAFGLVHIEPHPVVAIVAPWNHPLAFSVRKCAPALMAGACVVLLAPKEAPLTILRFAELMHEAGIPPGVFNVLTGNDETAEALAQSRAVDLLWYGGMVETARRMLLGAAKSNLKPVRLELGGKCSSIVFPDANVHDAVHAVAASIFTSRCTSRTACSRVIVHESAYESVADMLSARAKEVVVGDPLDEHTELGPMISDAHANRVLAYVELGRREGAKLVAGGTRHAAGRHASGAFVRPTVFVDARASMRVTREEIAGPVVTVSSFSTEDEAIELANASDFALAHSIWTSDVGRAHRISRRVDAGVVWLNAHEIADAILPFGGNNLSGHGRDSGRWIVDECSRAKAVYVSYG